LKHAVLITATLPAINYFDCGAQKIGGSSGRDVELLAITLSGASIGSVPPVIPGAALLFAADINFVTAASVRIGQ
jgi:hypothetical protein